MSTSSPARAPFAIAAALLALAALAAAFAVGASDRSADRQEVVRLLERANAVDARFRCDWQTPTAREPQRLVTRWRFVQSGLSGWTLLDVVGDRPVVVKAHDPGLAAWAPVSVATDTKIGKALRFPLGRGAIGVVFKAEPSRLYEIGARVRRAAPAAPLSAGEEERQARLIVHALQEPIELASELGKLDYPILVARHSVRVSGANPYATTATAPLKTCDQFCEIAATILTPVGTETLLLIFAAGDGSAHAAVDLEEVAIRDASLRHALGWGGRNASDPPAPESVAWSDSQGLPALAPPDPTQPSLRRIDDLLERREALLLPPPSSASLDADLPSGELALEFGLARLFERRSSWRQEPITFSLRAEAVDAPANALSADFTLDGGVPAGWSDHEIDLTPLAGRRARFTFATRSKASVDLVALGAPLVRRRAARDPRWNVVLVSIDTVRADHISCNGCPRPTTPHLDELARASVWFRNVESSSSFTLPAHGTMLSGALPSRHGAESDSSGHNRLTTDHTDLLAARLREAGWLTAAFTGSILMSPCFGFDQGFDRYDATDLLLNDRDVHYRSYPEAGDVAFNRAYRQEHTLERALDWLRSRRDGRFFLFLHTYLVHGYSPSAPFDARLHSSCASTLGDDLVWIHDQTQRGWKFPAAADVEHYVDLYDATLREADDAIGRLIETLRQSGLYERTLLIVTSDHGEEFLDHSGFAHGWTLHEEVTHVPWILHAPGVAPREIREPVSLCDLAPTVLDFVGLEPRNEIDGRSLAPYLRDRRGVGVDSRLEAELANHPHDFWLMRREGGRKLLERWDPDASTSARESCTVYATDVDPRETLPIELGEESQLRRDLGRQHELVVKRRAAHVKSASLDEIPADVRKMMEELGYPVDSEKGKR